MATRSAILNSILTILLSKLIPSGAVMVMVIIRRRILEVIKRLSNTPPAN